MKGEVARKVLKRMMPDLYEVVYGVDTSKKKVSKVSQNLIKKIPSGGTSLQPKGMDITGDDVRIEEV